MKKCRYVGQNTGQNIPAGTARGDITLFLLIFNLLQHIKQLGRIWQTQLSRILQQRNDLICRVENNCNIPQTRAAADDLNVKHVSDRDNDQHKDFLCDTLCADFAGKLLLSDRNDNARYVVRNNQHKQGFVQTVELSDKEPRNADNTADNAF